MTYLAATIGGFTWGGIVLVFMAFVELFVLIRLTVWLGAIYRTLGQQMVQAKILNDNLMENAERLAELGRATSTRLADEIMHERQAAEAAHDERG